MTYRGDVLTLEKLVFQISRYFSPKFFINLFGMFYDKIKIYINIALPKILAKSHLQVVVGPLKILKISFLIT